MPGWTNGRVPATPQIGERNRAPRPPAVVPPPAQRTGNPQLDLEARITRLEEMSKLILERLQYALDDHESIMAQMFNMQRELYEAIGNARS